MFTSRLEPGHSFKVDGANDFFTGDVREFASFSSMHAHFCDAISMNCEPLQRNSSIPQRSEVLRRRGPVECLVRLCLKKSGIECVTLRNRIIAWLRILDYDYKAYTVRNAAPTTYFTHIPSYPMYHRVDLPRQFHMIRNLSVYDPNRALESVFLEIDLDKVCDFTQMDTEWVLLDWFQPPNPPLPLLALSYHEVAIVIRGGKVDERIVPMFDGAFLSRNQDFYSFNQCDDINQPMMWLATAGWLPPRLAE